MAKRNIVLTFEGGGAKAIAHLGALQAIEKLGPSDSRPRVFEGMPEYVIAGVNGTSSGALVAALVAAGYSSSEMLDHSSPQDRSGWAKPDAHSVVLSNVGLKSAWALLPKGALFLVVICNVWNWATADRNRGNRSLNKKIRWWRILPLYTFLIALALVYINYIAKLSHSIAKSATSVLNNSEIDLVLLFVHICFWTVPPLGLAYFLKRGFSCTFTLSTAIDRALAIKIFGVAEADRQRKLATTTENPAGRLITFQTLKDKSHLGTKTLAVAATNVTHGTVEVFSARRTPNIFVSDAVVASMCLPVLFKEATISFNTAENSKSPQLIKDRELALRLCRFRDGGFTSNLPVWTSDLPRKNEPDLMSLAIELREKQKPNETAGLIYASVFGTRPMELRRTRHYCVRINTHVDLTAFRMKGGIALKHKLDAYSQFLYASESRRLARAAADQVCEIGIQLLKSSMHASDAMRGRVIRASIVEPLPGAREFRTIFRKYDASRSLYFNDDRLVYQRNLSFIGNAFTDPPNGLKAKLAQLRHPMTDAFLPERLIEGPQPKDTRYATPLLWSEARWALAIPFDAHAAFGNRLALGANDDSGGPNRFTRYLLVFDSNERSTHFSSLTTEAAVESLASELAQRATNVVSQFIEKLKTS